MDKFVDLKPLDTTLSCVDKVSCHDTKRSSWFDLMNRKFVKLYRISFRENKEMVQVS